MLPSPADRTKTLDDLEGPESWRPEPRTRLEFECRRLRGVPLCDLELADLIVLLGQDSGLEFVAPLALGYVAEDPLLSADHLPGDLLCALLACDPAYWARHPELDAERRSAAAHAWSSLRVFEGNPGFAAAVRDALAAAAGRAGPALRRVDPSAQRRHPRATLELPDEGLTMQTAVTELAPGLVRLDDIPVFTSTVQYGDVLQVRARSEAQFEFLAVAQPTRWKTWRLYLSREDAEGPLMRQFGARLTGLGCHWVRDFGGLLSIAVPPEFVLNPLELFASLERSLQ